MLHPNFYWLTLCCFSLVLLFKVVNCQLVFKRIYTVQYNTLPHSTGLAAMAPVQREPSQCLERLTPLTGRHDDSVLFICRIHSLLRHQLLPAGIRYSCHTHGFLARSVNYIDNIIVLSCYCNKSTVLRCVLVCIHYCCCYSVCPSVRLSVTAVNHAKTVQDIDHWDVVYTIQYVDAVAPSMTLWCSSSISHYQQ